MAKKWHKKKTVKKRRWMVYANWAAFIFLLSVWIPGLLELLDASLEHFLMEDGRSYDLLELELELSRIILEFNLKLELDNAKKRNIVKNEKDSCLSPTTIRNGVEQHQEKKRDKDDDIAQERILLASTLDGTLVALSSHTGEIIWSLKEKPTVKSPNVMHEGKPVLPVFLPDPKDGSIYTTGDNDQNILEKLPFTIPELVASSPCKSSDGTFYAGKKVDTWYTVDRFTGTKTGSISFEGCMATNGTESSDSSLCPKLKYSDFLIGRTEYNLKIFNGKLPDKQWNIEFHDYSSNIKSDLTDYGLEHFTDCSKGSLATLSQYTGEIQWNVQIGSPVVALYLIQGSGIVRVPFTSVAKETLSNLLDHYSDVNNINVVVEIGNTSELTQYPKLYIGEHQHGLYAMPSLVDQPTHEILASAKSSLLLNGPLVSCSLPEEDNNSLVPISERIDSKIANSSHDVNDSGTIQKENGISALFHQNEKTNNIWNKGDGTDNLLEIELELSRIIMEFNLNIELEAKRKNRKKRIKKSKKGDKTNSEKASSLSWTTIRNGLLGHFEVPDFSKTTLFPTVKQRRTFSGLEEMEDSIPTTGTYSINEKQTWKNIEINLIIILIIIITSLIQTSYKNIDIFKFIKYLNSWNVIICMVEPSTPVESENIEIPDNSSTPMDSNDETKEAPIDRRDRNIKVGAITFDPNHILGKGSEGTFVFKGTFDNREVAVKRVLEECFSVANREVELLRESDLHPHVIRYFCMEKDRQFRYIALEYCSATLQDYVEGNYTIQFGDTTVKTINALSILRQATEGLLHLHMLDICHRDIKPQNILIALHGKNNSDVRAMISDFGLCKKLKVGRMSFSRQSGMAGTEGWMAPEVMTGTRSNTCAVDTFSLGCVYYYVFSMGHHPFGEIYHRQANILDRKYSLSGLSSLHSTTQINLIKTMIDNDPNKRPPTAAVLKHPVFWGREKILNFLMDVSDRIEKDEWTRKGETNALLDFIERNASRVIRNDWLYRLQPSIINDLRHRRSLYYENTVSGLLRAIRNKKHHYHELSDNIKRIYGDIPYQFTKYWICKFPQLLIHCWVAMNCVKNEPLFHKYYHKEYEFIQVEYQKDLDINIGRNKIQKAIQNARTNSNHPETIQKAIQKTIQKEYQFPCTFWSTLNRGGDNLDESKYPKIHEMPTEIVRYCCVDPSTKGYCHKEYQRPNIFRPKANRGVEDMAESNYPQIHETPKEEVKMDSECLCSSEPSSVVLHWEERICDTDKVEEQAVTFEINLELSQQLGEVCSYNQNVDENASVPNDASNNNDFLAREGFGSLFPQFVNSGSSLTLSPQSPYARSSYWSNISLQEARNIHPEIEENGYFEIDISNAPNQCQVNEPKLCDSLHNFLPNQAVEDILETLHSHSNLIARVKENTFILHTANRYSQLEDPNKKQKRRKRKKVTIGEMEEVMEYDHDTTQDLLLFYINHPDEDYEEPDEPTWILVSNEWHKRSRKKTNVTN